MRNERRGLRCERCGCTGVEHRRGPANAREWGLTLFLATFVLVPAFVFASQKLSKPYCVRCRTRVEGTGVSPFDTGRHRVPRIGKPTEAETSTATADSAEEAWSIAT